MPQLVFRENGIDGKPVPSIEYFDSDIVVTSERHMGKQRNARIKKQYVLTEAQSKMPMNILIRMAADGKLPVFAPGEDKRSANEKAIASVAKGQQT